MDIAEKHQIQDAAGTSKMIFTNEIYQQETEFSNRGKSNFPTLQPQNEKTEVGTHELLQIIKDLMDKKSVRSPEIPLPVFDGNVKFYQTFKEIFN